MEYYGQLSQDRWVIDQVRSRLGRLRRFTFVDVGAYDGKTISNTLLLEQMGWTGVCVEPHPVTINELRKNRKCVIENVAAHNTTGKATFKMSNLDPMLSGIISEGQEVEVDTMTLDDILAKHRISSVEYLSIDTEGTECEVLEGLSIDPFAITIEHNGHSNRSAFITEWLSSRNYLFRRVEWDIWAVKDVSSWKVEI